MDGQRARLAALGTAIGVMVGLWGPRAGGLVELVALTAVILLAATDEAPWVLSLAMAAGLVTLLIAWPLRPSLFLVPKLVGTLGLVGWSVYRRWRPALVVLAAVAPTALVVMLGAGSTGALREELLESGRSLESLLTELGLEQAQGAEAVERTVSLLVTLFPAMTLLSALADGVVALAIAGPMARKLGLAVPGLPPFRAWRVWDEFIWAFIVGLGLAFFGVGALVPVGMNLAALAGAVYAVQGLAIVSWGLWRWRLSWPVRLCVYCALLLGHVLTLGFGVCLGVIDTWVDVRRLSRGGGPPAQPEGGG